MCRYVGVRWRGNIGSHGQWLAGVCVGSKVKVFIGLFEDEVAAAHAYDKYITDRGDDPVNFPASNDGDGGGSASIGSASSFPKVRSKQNRTLQLLIKIDGMTKHIGVVNNEIQAWDEVANFTSKRRRLRAAAVAPSAVRKTSRFAGVRWAEQDAKWCVGVNAGGLLNYVGHYVDEVAAARAYDAFVTRNGLDLRLNRL